MTPAESTTERPDLRDESAEPSTSVAPSPWHRAPAEVPRLLIAAAAERADLERSAVERFEHRTKAAEQVFRDGISESEARRAAAEGETRAVLERAVAQAERAFATGTAEAKKRDAAERASAKSHAKSARDAAEGAHQGARWEANTLYEASQRAESERDEGFRAQVAVEVDAFEDLKFEAETLLAGYAKFGVEPAPAPAPTVDPTDDPLEVLQAAIARVVEAYESVAALRLPRIFRGGGAAWLFLLPFLAIAPAAWYFAGLEVGLGAGVVGALLVGFGLRALLYGRARINLARLTPPLRSSIAEVDALVPEVLARGASIHKTRSDANKSRRDEEVTRADRIAAEQGEKIAESERTRIARLDVEVHERLENLKTSRSEALSEAHRGANSKLSEVESRHESEKSALQSEFDERRRAADDRSRRDWEALEAQWGGAMAAASKTTAEVRSKSDPLFPPWRADRDGPTWRAAEAVPPAVRFGSARVDLAAIPHGIPGADRLKALSVDRFELPAFLAFPDRGSLLVEAPSSARDAANRALKGAMARLLTGLPPAKVRFTIVDPVGLGRNFAGFMHLADYSELLVTGRIWTEPQQIEERLADLGLHMENVIQHYLRDEYPTLDAYNRQAGEVAEPYRYLVIADFPAGFHEISAQRLMSIVQSGPRCGVFSLIGVDTDRPLPHGVSLDALRERAVVLRWERGRLVWKDEDFERFPFTPDEPPEGERFTRTLHEVGDAARAASRVEVPFGVVAPDRDEWWAGTTRAGFDVPLGRAGATKLQHMRLGKGTSQHVLIAGRTGSGKSTFLHALITNAALRFDPDEVELYLIDFKKGVEFKTYAQHELPHARVVAIESEREFGLSVLQRLDEELKRRGDAFRVRNVQDLNGYRGVPDAPPMPRVLLIVDEFQEFFVDDDKLAQESALLLDRLVRQGRAFGVHVILGSQTLGGAFSLARSTLGQMGVRVALQCSESDAHLILSEDNGAARLLTRPGEAIYNDANGMIEGNHIFQVVWLGDREREGYLRDLKALDAARNPGVRRPQVVFEGDVPADLARNARLAGLLEGPAPAESPKAATAPLGEAVAIKDPTAAVFRRMGGNNLLVVGQDAEAARGLFASALIGLAAEHPEGSVRFAVLDGTPDDSPEAGAFSTLAGCVEPHQYRVGGPRDASEYLDEISAELARRQSGEPSGPAPSTFLFLYDLSRFRDLRKSDDDYSYSFGRSDEPKKASPSQQLAELVREGPALGLHVVAWFDSLNNLTRAFDRQLLREFEMRVLFQMSSNDSSMLIDNPAANRLGVHRGLFASEDRGTLEKFRPYAWPDRGWLDSALRASAD